VRLGYHDQREDTLEPKPMKCSCVACRAPSLLAFALLATIVHGCGGKPEGPPHASLPDEGPLQEVAAAAPAAAKTVEGLVLDLKSDSLQTRVAAADALSRLGAEAKPAIPALLEAMDGRQGWSDFAMMDALSALGPTALPVLIETFCDAQNKHRTRAGRAIWTMGAAAESALPALRKALEDKDADVRALAERTIAKIESELRERDRPAQKAVAATKTAPAAVTSARAQDWAEFHGPYRDSLCRETGLLSPWPAEGLRLLWKCQRLGKGLSTVSIAGARIYTTGDRALDGQAAAQQVIALDLATQKELWATRIGGFYKDYGALCTPTVESDGLYAISTDGVAFCLDPRDGAVRWRKEFKEFDGKMMCVWPSSESPLIDGDRLICTPGGKDAGLVALDKKTGQVLWKCALPDLGPLGKDGAAYSSPIVAEIEGVRQYVQVVGRGVVGVAAESGKFLWGYNRLACDIANITHPLVRGNLVFVTNSYNTGSALLKITRSGEEFKAEEVYFLASKKFQNHHGGIVLVDDCIYGGSGLNKGEPTCLRMSTGEVLWKAKAPAAGSAAVLYADGHVIFRYDRGLLVLVEANPKAFQVKGQYTPLTAEGPAWAHPVVHDKRLYLRHDDLLMCYDLRQ
jgi:prepilin-type processing-associated H-X9-DG protein